EALVDQVPQEAAALRDAVRVGELRSGERVLGAALVLEEADEVARRGEGAAGHARVLALVDDLVEPPRLEPAVEGHRGGIAEAPAVARDELWGVELVVADVEPAVAALGVDGRVGDMAAVPERS